MWYWNGIGNIMTCLTRVKGQCNFNLLIWVNFGGIRDYIMEHKVFVSIDLATTTTLLVACDRAQPG